MAPHTQVTDPRFRSALLRSPGLNFVTGVNGSGKSAVMTAVNFALAGSAKASGKGTSNKKLVRHGARVAKAAVTIHNGMSHDGTPFR